MRYGENPHQRGRLLRRGRRADAPARRRNAVARQGVVVQQPARPERRTRAGRGVLRAGVCDRQAQQPLRLRARQDGARRLRAGLRQRPAVSAYGGVIALNRPVDEACAQALSKQFIEVLLAPAFDARGVEVLTRKKNVRLLELPDWPEPSRWLEAKPVIGGLLVQDRDEVSETARSDAGDEHKATHRLRVAGHALCLAGLPPRALQRDRDRPRRRDYRHRRRPDEPRQRRAHRDREGPGGPAGLLAGSSLASDAFFPFADGPQLAIDAGVTAIVQPGGSVRDEEVVAAADAAQVAMVATGIRHFRH